MSAWEKERGAGRDESVVCGSVLGRVAGLDGATVLVSIGGREAVPARLLASVDRSLLVKPESVGREVLLMFAGHDSAQPIIVGVMENVLDELVNMEVEKLPEVIKPKEARVDGKRIVFEADHEIELKCGKSSILLQKSGKIVIKGSELLSRASGTNRIKGGSVGIN